MPTRTENWGELKILQGAKKEDQGSCSSARLELLSLPKDKEKTDASFVPSPLLSIPIQSIANASGTTKNDITLSIQQQASTTTSKGAEVELLSVRFAVPNTCVGYDQTEEAGKEILQEVQQAIRASHADIIGDAHSERGILRLATLSSAQKHSDEKIICVFDDVFFSSPSGKYKLIISNYHVVLEDKKKTSSGVLSFLLSDITQVYLCDIPRTFSKTNYSEITEELSQYVVLILKKPIKIRASSYAHVVISCPSGLALDEAHAWQCELNTQEAINDILRFQPQDGADPPLTPTMSGRVSEILLRAFKAVAKVPAYGAINKEYRTVLTQKQQSCMRALYRSSEGLLYVLNGGFIFLHRPALKLSFSDVSRVEVDESEGGVATFQIAVYTQIDKHVFSGIDKVEKDDLLRYLRTVTKVNHIGVETEEEDDEEDEEEDDEEESEEESSNDEDIEDKPTTKKRSKKSHDTHKHHHKDKHSHRHKKHRKE